MVGDGEPIETKLKNEEQQKARQNWAVASTDLEPYAPNRPNPSN